LFAAGKHQYSVSGNLARRNIATKARSHLIAELQTFVQDEGDADLHSATHSRSEIHSATKSDRQKQTSG
jgi:hypothetical protein